METLNFNSAKILLCAIFIFFACSDKLIIDQELHQNEPAIPEDATFVSTKQAIEVANAFFHKQDGLSAIKNSTGERKASVEVVKDENNPLLYVVNYPEGGWAIVSATRDYYPILAYSDENKFDLIPDGPASIWLAETKEAIHVCNALDDNQKTSISFLWKEYESQNDKISNGSMLKSFTDPLSAFYYRRNELTYLYGSSGWTTYYALSDFPGYLQTDLSLYNSLVSSANSYGSPPEYTIVGIKETAVNYTLVGPLLTTQWKQSNPFNYYCANGSAGCVTISLAQIMNFHKYPSTYIWNSMHENPTPQNSSIPWLIYQVGLALGINYTTPGSSAKDNDIKNALNSFGYIYTLANHDASDVWNELVNNNRPVSMGGYTNSILGVPCGDGHQWVCDGVKQPKTNFSYFVEYLQFDGTNYSYNGFGSSPSNHGISTIYGLTYYHQNWGWGGLSDGWYYNTTFPSGSYYQYERKNFYIRKP